jgi:hypothetical protein
MNCASPLRERSSRTRPQSAASDARFRGTILAGAINRVHQDMSVRAERGAVDQRSAPLGVILIVTDFPEA